MKQTWKKFIKGTLKRDARLSMLDVVIDEYILSNKIFKYSKPAARLLEVGCGTALVSIFLNKMGYRTSAIDIDEEIVRMAKGHNAKLGAAVDIRRDDARRLHFGDDSFDIAFNGGVMEHFSDEDIVRVLNEAHRVASMFIFEVPTPNAKNTMTRGGYGDERLLPTEKWRELIGRTKWRIMEVFYINPTFSLIKSNPLKVVYLLLGKTHKICVAQGFVLAKS